MEKAFREILKAYLDQEGIKPIALAEKLNMSRAYVSDFLNGKTNPPSEQVVNQLARLLKLSQEQELELIVLAESERNSPTVKKLLSAGFEKLKETGRAKPVLETRPRAEYLTREEAEAMFEKWSKEKGSKAG